MREYALIFPGQGAQKCGMGKELYETSPAAKRVFDTADKVIGYSISELCFSGSEEEIKQTINSQPCILAVSIAAFEALREKTAVNYKYTAGHSLGEYAALYAAGVVDLETVFKLIHKRAELMNEAAQAGNGGMAAVLGLDDEKVNNVVKTLNNVYAANYNSPGQVVITGDAEEINNSTEKFKAAGAKKVIPLAVSGAFHSPMMKEASEKFENYIKQFEFKDTVISVYTNTDAKAENRGDVFKSKLPKQICSPVLWTQTITDMINKGISDYIELGPGKVLAGLNKKINSEIKTINIYDEESLNTALSEITDNREKELV